MSNNGPAQPRSAPPSPSADPRSALAPSRGPVCSTQLVPEQSGPNNDESSEVCGLTGRCVHWVQQYEFFLHCIRHVENNDIETACGLADGFVYAYIEALFVRSTVRDQNSVLDVLIRSTALLFVLQCCPLVVDFGITGDMIP
ncbi:hypothetical protein EYF80_048785 [Liparis tanakae]|uniref:Uncharacterized protein n=1 Tax=Liparis tanakae TaxID=230148 RepID=A0A4Z2FIM3_9TELE|nr:hypothetical protein EYF80_048785 [Liparis tanakae]